jgi:acyl carrier protein
MDRQDVLAGMADVAVELLGVDREVVTPEARFEDDLGVDSLGLVEFVMAIEDRFGIKVPESKLEGITTVGEAVDLVLDSVGETAGAETGAGG